MHYPDLPGPEKDHSFPTEKKQKYNDPDLSCGGGGDYDHWRS